MPSQPAAELNAGPGRRPVNGVSETAKPHSAGKPSRTGPELILATKPFTVDNTVKSWWYFLSTTVLLIAALAGTIWNFHPLGRVLCSLLAGLLTLRLFVIYHDQQHHAILPRSKLAEWLMRGFGIYALSPSSVWRSSHNHHHNHNSKIKGSHIGSFPIMTREHYLKSKKSARFLYLFTRHPGTIFLGYVFVFLQGMCLLPFLRKPKEHFDCLVALVVHFSISVALVYYTGWTGLLLSQTLPHLITFGLGSYLFYAQHNFPGVSFYDKAGWTYERAALESSSHLKTGKIMAWFTANIGFHHIHHLNSRIPFYRLPEVSRALPELQNPKTTSLNPLEIMRCLRLKVWDAEKQRMVGLG
ncbi:MAG: fatty acid desaturase [Verrucomicrobiaceae bacterium]|nr:MAG: fatty acid desaturase [Verrucomicrobiaceae bacterium]